MAVENMLRARLEETTEAVDEAQYLASVADVIRDFPGTIELLNSPHPLQRYTSFAKERGMLYLD